MNLVRGAFAIAAVAAGLAGSAMVAGVARGDEASSTGALLDSIEHGGAHGKDAADMVKRARDAMERATRFRSAGDEPHARLADGLARETAEAARDLVRTIDAEQAADDARRAAIDAGTRGERERALLEEGIARNGRLRAEIDEVGKPRVDAKTSRTASSDGGAPTHARAPGRTDDSRAQGRTDDSRAPGRATDAPAAGRDGGAP